MSLYGRWTKHLRVVVVIVLLCLAVLVRGCFFRGGTTFPGPHFNKGTNAAWLDITWVKDQHDSAEIAALVDELDRDEIRYVFAYASYLKSDGQFNPTYSHAAEFTRAVKARQPNLNVQAWIGLPLNRQGPLATRGHADLGDPATREKIASFCADLIRAGGFDGIHLDPEPISGDDADMLTLLEEIREAIGPDRTLSIATRRIWPVFSDNSLPMSEQLAWRASYYREVAKRVDQIAVMMYDSGMPLPVLYRQWSRFQVIEISRAVYGTNVNLFFGIPTSEERTRTHLPSAENMTSGLQGVIDGLNDAQARPSAVTGVAIYPHWETDASDWTVYESLWLGKR